MNHNRIRGIIIKKAPLFKKAPLVCPGSVTRGGGFLINGKLFLLKDERRSGQFIRKPPLVCPRFATRGAFLIIIPLIAV